MLGLTVLSVLEKLRSRKQLGLKDAGKVLWEKASYLCWGTPRLPKLHSGLMIPLKDSWYSEKLLYSSVTVPVKGHRLKWAKEKGTQGGAQETMCKILVIPSQWNHMDSTKSPANDMWQQAQKIVSQGSSPKTWCPALLLGGQPHRHGAPVWLTSTIQTPSPTDNHLITV